MILSGVSTDLYPLGGSGSDGALTTSGNVTYTEAVGVNTVKYYTNVTVNSGHTITRTNRGAIIWFVRGEVSISGTINLDYLGYAVDTYKGYVHHEPYSSQLGAWLVHETYGTGVHFLAGGDGGDGGTTESGNGGVASIGNAFSGGHGGGGASLDYSAGWITEAGLDAELNLGGHGAPAVDSYEYGIGGGGGGAGSGPQGHANNWPGQDGGSHPGGALYIFCKGNITIAGSAHLNARGGNGGNGGSGTSGHSGAGGGGAGGGIIAIIYGGTYSNSGAYSVVGGSGGSSGGSGATAGNGGSSGTFYANKYGT